MSAFYLKGFIGGAGTGKTHNLVLEAEAIARTFQWEQYQAMLGLTFMHGARRRLDNRLSQLKADGVPVQCRTIDSFCLDLVRRFRKYLGYDRTIELDMGIEDCNHCECLKRYWVLSLKKMRSETLRLLENSVIKKMVAASYPVLIIDEFQDCDGPLLRIIQALSEKCKLYVAADPFQRLEIEDHSCDGTICDAFDWIQKAGETVLLEKNERTKKGKLLNTATALRSNEPVKGCINVEPFRAPGLAAYHIAKSIRWYGWGKGSSTAIISPTTGKKSPFVAQVLKSLQKELGQKQKIGPYPFYWEKPEKDQFYNICEFLPSYDSDNELVFKDELQNLSESEDNIVSQSCKSANRLATLRGEEGVSKAELINIVRKRLHGKMAYCSFEDQKRRIALTVYGAKNREFGHVFALWPNEIKSDTLFQRKLLYNAITRASEKAIVLVQGTQSRINKDKVLGLIKN